MVAIESKYSYDVEDQTFEAPLHDTSRLFQKKCHFPLIIFVTNHLKECNELLNSKHSNHNPSVALIIIHNIMCLCGMHCSSINSIVNQKIYYICGNMIKKQINNHSAMTDFALFLSSH